MTRELLESSVVRLAESIREGRVSSAEVTSAFIARIEAVNDELNAVVQLRAGRAMDAARSADEARSRGKGLGPLHGVPVTVKDSFETAGIVTTGGTEGLSRHVPERNATVVRRLLDAGAIVLGKTNTPELTFAYETDNRVYGRTLHPVDPERTPGGSSGGATAILAAGGSPLDVGSDTGGSIRVPSHFCGTAGLKPTAGRVPRTGHLISYEGPFQSLTQIGPLARYVEDVRLALEILEGPDWRDPFVHRAKASDAGAGDPPPLRCTFYTDNGILPADHDVAAAVRASADALADAGARVKETRPPRLEESLEILYDVFGADGGDGIRGFLEALGTRRPSRLIEELLELLSDRRTSTVEFQSRLTRLDAWRSDMLAWFRDHDVILCPPAAGPAPRHGTTNDPGRLPGFSYASAYNLTGWPAAVVRVGTSADGLPIGVQVVGRPWADHRCLDVASRLEEALGGERPR